MKKPALFLRKGLWALCSLFFLFLVLFLLAWIYMASQLPDVESLKTVQLQVPLRIYSKDGQLIQEYGEKRRIPLEYHQIPPTLVHALLATEDQRFFEHPGVDVFGLGRAAISVLQTGSKSQGGSTITMQVARNFFLSRKKTYLRKFNEILLAIKIDRELPKEKILELYLNKIYLGNRAYGVGAAAMVYYGKDLNDLSLAQLAMIAGLPQAPSSQNPIANPIAALKRRNHVLGRLLEEKYISEQQYQEAIRQPVTAKYHGTSIDLHAPYVAEMIRQSLYEHFGPEAYTKGYKVYTTLNSKLQKAANETVRNHLISYDKRHGYRGPIGNIGDVSQETNEDIHKILARYPKVHDLEPAIVKAVYPKSALLERLHSQAVTLEWSGLSWAKPALKRGWVGKEPSSAHQILEIGDIVYIRRNAGNWQLSQLPNVEAALVAMNPVDGAIETLVGGFDFQKSKYNRATQMERQPGSTFKPFIYAAALNKGYNLATMINDAPIVINDPSQVSDWRPQNANRKFGGPTRLKEGLIRSRNLVSIRILNDIGIDYTVDFISRFGIKKDRLPHSLSLALGSLSISPIDLTSAYAIFANGGFKVDPYLIDHITDAEGEILLQAKPALACESCVDEQNNPHSQAQRVIPADLAFLMNSALRDVVQQGTARGAKSLGRSDIAGKTGTTNEQVDTWFAGFSPDLVATAWVGYDNPAPLYEYAAQLALPLWVDFMREALQDSPQRHIVPPENIVAIPINPKTGQSSDAMLSSSVTEYFRQGEVPGNSMETSNFVSSPDHSEAKGSEEYLF
ncbi:MAG: penicillin-binding protein 1A [Legionellaceae bacterium]|nr:penicillin-binding protein 1A [Legionellaceae bacterium]